MARLAFQGNRSSMGFGDPLDDGEAEAKAVVVAVVSAHEPAK
jgi:hypothetical protein